MYGTLVIVLCVAAYVRHIPLCSNPNELGTTTLPSYLSFFLVMFPKFIVLLLHLYVSLSSRMIKLLSFLILVYSWYLEGSCANIDMSSSNLIIGQ